MSLQDLKPGDMVAVIELSRGEEVFRRFDAVKRVTPKTLYCDRGEYSRETGTRKGYNDTRQFIRVPVDADTEAYERIRQKEQENAAWHKEREEKQAQDAAFLNDFNFCGLLAETLTEIRALIQKDKDEVGW